jgi:hypothetical protein
MVAMRKHRGIRRGALLGAIAALACAAPAAAFTSNRVSPCFAPCTVTFTAGFATGLTDSDYTWDSDYDASRGFRVQRRGRTVTFTYTSPGTYNPRMEARRGGTSIVEQSSFTVRGVAQPPGSGSGSGTVGALAFRPRLVARAGRRGNCRVTASLLTTAVPRYRYSGKLDVKYRLRGTRRWRRLTRATRVRRGGPAAGRRLDLGRVSKLLNRFGPRTRSLIRRDARFRIVFRQRLTSGSTVLYSTRRAAVRNFDPAGCQVLR